MAAVYERNVRESASDYLTRVRYKPTDPASDATLKELKEWHKHEIAPMIANELARRIGADPVGMADPAILQHAISSTLDIFNGLESAHLEENVLRERIPLVEPVEARCQPCRTLPRFRTHACMSPPRTHVRCFSASIGHTRALRGAWVP